MSLIGAAEFLYFGALTDTTRFPTLWTKELLNHRIIDLQNYRINYLWEYRGLHLAGYGLNGERCRVPI